MNVDLLRHIQAEIAGSPNQFSMDYWTGWRNGEITHCIGGLAIMLMSAPPVDDPEVIACELIGLDWHQGSRLFYVYQWPPQYKHAYKIHACRCDLEGLAKLAIARIQWFIDTKGTDCASEIEFDKLAERIGIPVSQQEPVMSAVEGAIGACSQIQPQQLKAVATVSVNI